MSLPLKELIRIGETQLADAGVADAAIDAKELYCYMMHIDRSRLMLQWQEILQDNQCEDYFELVARRAARIPLQHITGTQAFMGLTFSVDETVLIPRQDTETLVEDALSVMRENRLRGEALPRKAQKGWTVLDMGCGSGAIGLSLAALSPDAKVTLCDNSQAALKVTRQNAKRLGLKGVQIEESDMFGAFSGKLGDRKFDLIISNPPYIPRDVIPTLEPEVALHEPLEALDGGPDGLEFYRCIAREAADHLKKSGVLMLEIGHDQLAAVTDLLAQTARFPFIRGCQDLAGRDRVVCAIAAPKPDKARR